jgi:hypothetical protein
LPQYYLVLVLVFILIYQKEDIPDNLRCNAFVWQKGRRGGKGEAEKIIG